MKKGLVSVTFRQFDAEKIVRICKKADLKYIEWGGDIHVPAGDLEKAVKTAALCRNNGIIPVGYGSYYNAADGISAFIPALQTAKALGAEYIRIWAGRSAEYKENIKNNIKEAVAAAKEAGIAVSLESHRKTLTENAYNAVMLADKTGCLLHFQPNPDITVEQNLAALKLTAPYLCACHVFAWKKGDIRLPLADHADKWSEYANAAGDVPFLLEFVKDNGETSLYKDALTLDSILRKRFEKSK